MKSPFFLFVIFIFSVSVQCQSNGVMNLVLFDSETTGAICNDGTPAGFYWRNGTGDGTTKYVLHLQGGAWCNDQDSCEYRYQSSIDLMSSSQWTPTIYMTYGLFSQLPANNSWYNANSVYVMYCSSDVWSGNGSATYPDGTHYEFRGKVIIQALINLLWTSYGMDQASEILFSGCSAGGQGVVVNLDYVNELLKQKQSTALLKGFADAGWLQNFVPYYSTEESTSYQMTTGITMWNGQVEKNCKLANPGWEWLCYFSPFAYPYIKTPIFIQTEQFDTYQVTSNCQNPPFDPAEWEYVQTIRTAFISSLQNMVNGVNSFYSAACFHHCSSEDSSYNTILINGNSLSTVLSNWFYERPGVSRAMDFCQGFNCSVGCPQAPY